MRVRPLAGILLLPAILATAGCDAVLTTAQLTPVREDGILGEWKDLGVPGTKPEADRLVIRFTEGMYRIGTASDFESGKATAFTLSRAGSALIAQSAGEGQCDEFSAGKGQACWMLNRVELVRDRLNWYDFDAQRLGRESFSGSLNIAHSVHRERKNNGSFDTSVLLSADAAGLQRFLEGYATRKRVLLLTGRLERMR